MGTRGRGDVGTWGRGDLGTRGRGDVGTWGRRDVGTRRHIFEVQSNLDYPDLDYPDFSIIRTFSVVPFFS